MRKTFKYSIAIKLFDLNDKGNTAYQNQGLRLKPVRGIAKALKVYILEKKNVR